MGVIMQLQLGSPGDTRHNQILLKTFTLIAANEYVIMIPIIG